MKVNLNKSHSQSESDAIQIYVTSPDGISENVSAYEQNDKQAVFSKSFTPNKIGKIDAIE